MDTRLIEDMIAAQCSDPEPDPDLCELLAVVAERHDAVARAADIARAARFVMAYIGQVPYMLKVASTAATTVGLEAEMRGVLQAVESYWLKGDDVIPDELGVIGLLDDAYCSLASLQTVSDHFRLQTGKHLFPDDLGEANAAIREIIGEPYASELDQLVVRTMRSVGLVRAVTALASEDKRLDLEQNRTIWSHGPAGRLDVRDLERLGVSARKDSN